MSKLQKTAIKIDSNKKKAILYSFILDFIEGLHESKVQTGIKKVVNTIINNARPSIPKITLLFDKINQSNFSTNWKPPKVMSKKNNNRMEALKITKDQNNEKLRIKLICVLSVKTITKQPINGKQIIVDNNIINKIFVQRDSNSYRHIRSVLFYPLNYERFLRRYFFIRIKRTQN